MRAVYVYGCAALLFAGLGRFAPVADAIVLTLLFACLTVWTYRERRRAAKAPKHVEWHVVETSGTQDLPA